MPTIRLRSGEALLNSRRGILRTVSWQVRSNVWSPPTDVYETDQAYLVRVEIAGMRDEEFEVVFENGALFIAGSRPEIRERRAYHQMEIHFGRFATSMGIPGPVEVDQAEANYADGFLTVTLPKARSHR
jgi:HSP20 family protein